MIWCYFFKKSG